VSDSLFDTFFPASLATTEGQILGGLGGCGCFLVTAPPDTETAICSFIKSSICDWNASTPSRNSFSCFFSSSESFRRNLPSTY
ncbi:hypothetical protein PENTCL1PPCAC_7949, partial [Pristionchus entomophagus]